MHTSQPHFPEKPMLPLGDPIGYFSQNASMASVLNGFVQSGIKRPLSFHNVNIQPPNACTRNFIILDQTNKGSQAMYHPKINSKLLHNPNFGGETSFFLDDVQKDPNGDNNISSSFEEDSNDINALLSSEFEESEEVDDDEVSTARTGAYYDCSSPDSCSNYEPVLKKRRAFFGKSSGIRGSEKKKHDQVRKMVNALRGIVPGANRMSTAAVLDESVKYLKSLRVEVQKLGIKSFEG